MAQHSAKHLIIGGGILGCSIAYHLTRMGEKDVVLLERANLTEGATWHAAGLVGQLRSSRNTTRMLKKSVEMYDRLQNEDGLQFDWKKTGSLRLAATKERMLEAKRLATMARSFDLDMQIISPSEAKELFPLIEERGLEGAAFIPTDGYVDPASLCQAVAGAARRQGANIRQNVEVLDFNVTDGRITSVETTEGRWEAETIILATGMWSREIAAKLGLKIPACAVEHQYIITESTGNEIGHYPTLRDPERLVYYKPDVGGRLVVGGYEDATLPFGDTGIPGKFVRQLLPENLDRFLPLAELAGKVTPVINEVGIMQVINGPIPYSADGDFVMGWQPGYQNLMLATGFLYGIAAGGGAGEMIAEWVVDGQPSLDLWPLDVRRFGPHHGTRAFMYPRAVEHYAHHYKMRYPGQEHETIRQLRLSPLYQRLKDQGAVYGSKNGWERPLWFAPNGVEPLDQLDFLTPGWKAFAAKEHMAVRENVALIDQSSFAKFEIIGTGVLAALQRLCVSNMDKPVGTIIYTQMCNAKGGIEADVTFIRLAKDRFYLVTGSGFGVHDSDWIERHLPDDGSVHVIEVTSAMAVINIAGPNARKVLAAASESDVSNAALPFSTARDIIIGAAPVRAARIGYVGELGYELHIPTEFAAHVYDRLWQAGKAHGITNVGYRAIESLRMEKGYVYWSGDISPDYTPIEAGLGFRVHLKSKGDFIGRRILEAQKTVGVQRRLCTFVTPENLPLTGGEAVLLGEKLVSLATSVGFGWTVGQTIIRGYLEKEHWDTSDFTLEVFGDRHPITQVEGPLYDPQNVALKG
ncbi:FAD-dependent oxidoreductase [Sulfitobacter sp. M57]|uniref:GcvT family protein n=1 Tax=unclassified Sulfitobacter TaxID=196795 RepID=UPI0023E2329A|nr:MULTISPECIES: FAD-dependent oxidoreductase [unclassified Sulfitobacter]MDF3415486.1 FAD-dependent oxidoreductase [Sulfitobacter sp. KE5]MDF3422967.1 FAD-dependent oxidoreductase [Sulfitobacter sp. KE43]MDF3434032.1 FAD-dependent oxidoreductase [Sulfitobacter sp. KE42]MDF3459935.1 FAD-dependent oxidoreductase [Sulfitobacter sp. S74]MDF3463571.1 FAD-dependent oxidoreductase [Sulfitobacter sp. Ks18]